MSFGGEHGVVANNGVRCSYRVMCDALAVLQGIV